MPDQIFRAISLIQQKPESPGVDQLVAVASTRIQPTRSETPDYGDLPWFVVRTQPHREKFAAENVARLGCFHYLPQVLEGGFIRREGGQRTKIVKARSMFPSYMFVLSPDQRWHHLLSCYGVVSVITHGSPLTGRPALLPAVEVAKLRRRERDGIVVLPEQNKFEQMQPVRLLKGAFAGHVGVVQGMAAANRVRVLLDVLGRKVPTLVVEAALEAA